MMLSRRGVLLALAGAATAKGVRGAVAFHYEAVFPPDALDWYTRFDTIVTGAVLSSGTTRELRRNKSRLIAYEWSSGFYPGDPVSAPAAWQTMAGRNARGWLLDPEPVGGGAAAQGKNALWYDFGSPELIAARTEYLAGVLGASGYDGLFFDTPGFEQLPAAMQAAFKRRHPKAGYNQCQGEFFGELKRRIGPNKIIFLNQGYRHAAEMLPHAGMDLTESYFTALDGTKTRFRKWHDPSEPWESVRTPMEQLVMPAAQKFPHVKFVHVNYAAGDAATARKAARYSWACAKLFGHESYLIAPGAYPGERDEVYFNDTGKPLPGTYQETSGIVRREFERGLVVLNATLAPARLPGSGLRLPEGQQGYWFPK